MTTTLGDPLAPDPVEFARLSHGIASSRRWTNSGPLAEELEGALRSLLGTRHAQLTTSGTAALTLALLALELPPGGEVITTPLTFAATALAIEAAGLAPVFAAVDGETLNLDPDAVSSAIGPRTAAILPVHLFGVAADAALDDLAAERGIPVVYDAAHAFGFAPIASRGTLTAYSLHATKILHTGEGGAVTSDDDALAARVRRARNFGLDERGVVVGAGTNGKLPETSAAVGLAMRGRLHGELAARERVREAYRRIVDSSDRVRTHAPGRPRGLVMEVVRCAPIDLDALRAELAERGVLSRTFPTLTEQGSRYAEARVVGASQPALSELARTVLALPIHGRVGAAALSAVAEVFAR